MKNNVLLTWIFAIVCGPMPCCSSTSQRPADSGTEFSTADTETGSDDPINDILVPACFFESFDMNAPDGAEDLDTYADGTTVVATLYGEMRKYNLVGELVSQMAICDVDSCRLRAIDAAPDGGVVVTGSFVGTLLLGPGEPNETSLDSVLESMFVARFSSEWELTWASVASGSTIGEGWGVALLPDESVVLAGKVQPGGYLVFGLDEENETTLTTPDGTATFLARYHADGSLDWASIEVVGGTPSREIAVLSDGSFVVTGQFMQSATLGAGKPGETTIEWTPIDSSISNSGEPDPVGIYLAKYDSSGAVVWVRTGSKTWPLGDQFPAALSDGSIALAGTFYDVLGFEGTHPLVASSQETGEFTGEMYAAMFVSRFTAQGKLVFAIGSTCDKAPECSALSSNPIEVDQDKIVVSGRYTGTVRFGVGDTASAVLGDTPTAFIAAFDYDGDLVALGSVGPRLLLAPSLSLKRAGVQLAPLADGTFMMSGPYSGEYQVELTDSETITGQAPSEIDGFVTQICPDNNFAIQSSSD